ncbi:hypothetical protein C1896_07675 [Pseudomonadaceae bacterium SI-3]|nr:hypothetical protein C1896_07675 [Pseudomonadaceae bacterium SI-3]
MAPPSGPYYEAWRCLRNQGRFSSLTCCWISTTRSASFTGLLRRTLGDADCLIRTVNCERATPRHSLTSFTGRPPATRVSAQSIFATGRSPRPL